MTFFYDLNKRLAALASKQDAQQLAEDAKATAPKSKLAESIDVAEAGYSAKAGRAGKDLGQPGKNFSKIAKGAAERYGSKAAGERVAGAVLKKLRHPKESTCMADEGNAFTGALKSTPKGGKFKVGGKEFTDTSSLEEVGMTPKQKKFAKLAPPVDKITFADKIAGAKKEVDEMLGDVAAEAIKSAVGKKKEPRSKGTAFDPEYMKQQQTKKDAESHSRYDVKDTGYSKRYTRKVEEPKDDDSDAPATKGGAPKKRGRPQGAPKGPERTTKGAWKHKGERKVKAEEDLDTDGVMMTRPSNMSSEGVENEGWRGGGHGERDLVKTRKPAAGSTPQEQAYNELGTFLAAAKFRGLIDPHYIDQITKLVKQLKPTAGLEEKAVSKKQQKFMGMVHAAQKGEKPASKEVAKVAKEMPKKAAKDFAATKHKGLPEKVKAKKESKEEKVEETADSAGSSKGGYNFGGGVYESLDSQFKQALTEGMNVSVNMNAGEDGEARKNITISADGEDADKLAELLKMAGLGGQVSQEVCPGCGSVGCSCEQELDENQPDWPTNTEYTSTKQSMDPISNDLNRNKSTGQTTIPVIASQLRRQVSMEENVELERSLFKTWKNYKG